MENKTFKEQSFKEILTASIWKIFGMAGIGFLLGYLVYRDSEKDGNPQIIYLWFLIGLFTLIGIIMFLVKVIPAYKKVLKERKEKENN
jgi:Na+/proline symporter